MARIQNVEKAKYINSNIEIYAKNKVGQYSKYLDKTPIFVTYYHICQSLSRADVGTGGIENELGERSPVRFNKVLNFPLYNIPEIKPDIVYDESGYDIDLDLSDIVALPNTIKPIPGDYFILKLPGMKEYLFRVNSFRYNTIQSNDFYSLDCDLKEIGTDIEDREIKPQIVGEYQTVFDNIGTEDRCFVKTDDIDYLNSIVDLYYKLRDYYKDAFYKSELNSFTIPIGYTDGGYECNLYDPYLEKFINESNLYYDATVEKTIILSAEDILPKIFNLNYSKSIYSAIIKRNTELLCKFPYAFYTALQKRFSTFNLENVKATTVNLIMSKEQLPNSTDIDFTNPNCNIELPWYDIKNLPTCIPVMSAKAQYFSFNLIESILSGTIDTDDYCELIIFNWINHIAMEYDRPSIISELDENIHNFYYLPLITYIFGQLYQEYFHKDSIFEL